jgi:hypothetical protein
MAAARQHVLFEVTHHCRPPAMPRAFIGLDMVFIEFAQSTAESATANTISHQMYDRGIL